MAYPYRVNIDTGLYLNIGQLLLGGEVPYVDFVEINFPLVYYISALAVLIASFLPITSIVSLHLIVVGFLLYCCTSTWFILKTMLGKEGIYLSSVFLLGFVLDSLIIIHYDNWAQREHMFILLFLPYAFYRYFQWQGKTLSNRYRIPLAVIAALGVCLKPHFIIYPLIMELWGVIRTGFKVERFWSPDIIVFGGTGFLFLLHIAVVPGMAEGFIEMLRLTSVGYTTTYWGRRPFHILIIQFPIQLVIFCYGLFRTWVTNDAWLEWLCMLASAALVVYLVQAKGFWYHWMPLRTITILIALYLSFPVNMTQYKKLGPRIVRGILSIVIVVNIIGFVDVVPNISDSPFDRDAESLIQEYTDDDASILILSSRLSPFRAALRTELAQTSRYFPSIPYPFSTSPDSNSEWLDQFLTLTANDIQQEEPEVLLIESNECEPCYGDAVALLTYLESIGFVQEYISPDYTNFGEYNGHTLFIRGEYESR